MTAEQQQTTKEFYVFHDTSGVLRRIAGYRSTPVTIYSDPEQLHKLILDILCDEREIREPGRIARLIINEIKREKITEAQ